MSTGAGIGRWRAGVSGLRLAFSLFTVIPVRTGGVDRQAAGRAMPLAPVAGLAIGGAQAAVLVAAVRFAGLSAAVAAILAVAGAAAMTRGLHLDGLADLADGLGSLRDADGALAVMKRSDIGPFGVVTLVLVLGCQVAALAEATGAGRGWQACLIAAVTGRAAVTLACRRGVPAARPDGMGALVAGTVPVAGCAAVAVAVTAVAFALDVRYAVGVVVALAAAWALGAHAVRRLGGITGDVLGALVETAVTVVLLAAAVR